MAIKIFNKKNMLVEGGEKPKEANRAASGRDLFSSPREAELEAGVSKPGFGPDVGIEKWV